MFNFTKIYEEDDFNIFLQDFLPQDYKIINRELKISDSFKLFNKAKLIGEVNSLNDLKIIDISHTVSDKSRITLSNDIFKLLSKFSYSNAIIVTHNPNDNNYRLSFVTSTLEWTSDKNIKKTSLIQKDSFLLGPNAKYIPQQNN